MEIYIVVYEPEKKYVYEICAVFNDYIKAKNYIAKQSNPNDFYIHFDTIK